MPSKVIEHLEDFAGVLVFGLRFVLAPLLDVFAGSAPSASSASAPSIAAAASLAAFAASRSARAARISSIEGHSSFRQRFQGRRPVSTLSRGVLPQIEQTSSSRIRSPRCGMP